MAFAPNIAKEMYKDLSIPVLEAKYGELKKNYNFNSREDQINYLIANRLNASLKTNVNSSKIALEELLKEKTGKEYTMETRIFDINLDDIIRKITDPERDPFWTMAITDFFKKLPNVSEEEKKDFLIDLVQDSNNFNEFTKEAIKNNNAEEVYAKYKELAHDYVIKNSKKS